MTTATLSTAVDTVATSPWVSEPGYCVRRVVVREIRGHYVVHTEQQEDGPDCTSYTHGEYFRKSVTDDGAKALLGAFNAFVTRSRRLLDRP